ncbi:MAG: hypothetical protein FWD96_06380, partial [Defluviitaleaceae bacterium]|nr:hypothetical protein [Defluviitaleaceae bacterium]
MFKTVFAKQFAFYFTIQLFSYILLAVALSYLFNSYFVSQQSQAMHNSAGRIAGIYHDGFTGNRTIDEVNRQLDIERYILSEHQSSSLIILSPHRYIFDVTPDMSPHVDRIFDMFEMFDFGALEQGDIVVTRGNMEGVFSEQVLMVGHPVIVDGALVCAVFVTSSMPDLHRSAQEMISIT